jgi:MarR family transcriptional regulator for hemolysin
MPDRLLLNHLPRRNRHVLAMSPEPKMVLLTSEGRKQCRLFHRLAADLEAELTTGLSMSQKLTLTKDLDMMEALLSTDHGASV